MKKIFISRYQATLIGKQENYPKIKRVLNSLNAFGFSNYSFELVKYLEIEIYGEVGGYDKYQTATKKTRNQVLPNFSSSPLNSLGGNVESFRLWKVFGDFGQDQKKIIDYENSTGIKVNEYKRSAYFK